MILKPLRWSAGLSPLRGRLGTAALKRPEGRAPLTMFSESLGFLWHNSAIVHALIAWAIWLTGSHAVAAEFLPRVVSTNGLVHCIRVGVRESLIVTNNMPLKPGDSLVPVGDGTAVVQLEASYFARVKPGAKFHIQAPKRTDLPFVHLLEGILHIFSRGGEEEMKWQTGHATLTTRGTEFVLETHDNQTLVTVLDGHVELTFTNALEGRDLLMKTNLVSNETGVLKPGPAARFQKRPIEAKNLVQWWLYYPGVLWNGDLSFSREERDRLKESLDAYRAGNLQRSLEAYPRVPPFDPPASDCTRLYLANLLLSAAQQERAVDLLNSVPHDDSLASALKLMIDAVNFRTVTNSARPRSASEWLGYSYYLQSRFQLNEAREAARKSVDLAPEFGFGWERLAELEFSFGRIKPANDDLDQALKHSPENAQAHALKGFLLSAENRIALARGAFEESIRLDPDLGNGWLGRGLCRIRKRDFEGGVQDLQMAAVLEPNRSFLRSYLGKAYGLSGDVGKSDLEIARAKTLDPGDPTAPLYSALQKYQQSQINAAVADLEASLRLNDNRAVYRSRPLLDQDRAVRSANLARIYEAAGMSEVAVQEASRAASRDYGNFSAHLFLAETFDALRDPTRFNLRYETPWLNELLLAYALAPVGGGNFSQHVSQQEYSRLFETDRMGFSSLTDVRSDGQWRQLASQFGTFGNTSYSLDLNYQRNEGVRPNNELSRIEWDTQIKQQFTPQDSVLFLASYQDYRSGDNFQYYDPQLASRSLKLDENEIPTLVGIYHHEWRPRIHTLLLGGRLTGKQDLSLEDWHQLVLDYQNGKVNNLWPPWRADDDRRLQTNLFYRSKLEAYVTELNQIIQTEQHAVVLGARMQAGELETMDRLPGLDDYFAPTQSVEAGGLNENFRRATLYGYDHWRLFDRLVLIGGLAYESLVYPDGFRDPPVRPGRSQRKRVLPKGGFVWDAWTNVTFRGMYAQSLGGVTFDQSYRLEPSQIGGFVQSFRSIVPESEVGSLAGADFETAGFAVDVKLSEHTYVGVWASRLVSEVDRNVGVLEQFPTEPYATRSAMQERLEFEERSLGAYINQLIGQEWSIGATYGLTRSDLSATRPDIPADLVPYSIRTEESDLHQLRFQLFFNHPSGVFSQAQLLWWWQQNRGYVPKRPGDSVAQLNFQIGYRFRHRKAEVSVGVLNLTDEDYRLSPLSNYSELPRERAYFTRLRVNL
ncbi:MAG: FecR domain-containing protein [Verrucomicrobia bacterium]|nr:FecR domain-containing protein [Verrucomicrobiota bacterium]